MTDHDGTGSRRASEEEYRRIDSTWKSNVDLNLLELRLELKAMAGQHAAMTAAMLAIQTKLEAIEAASNRWKGGF